MKFFCLIAVLIMNSVIAFSSNHSIDEIRKKYQLAVYDSKVANSLAALTLTDKSLAAATNSAFSVFGAEATSFDCAFCSALSDS
jgi:hypothetical protein